MLCTSGFMDVVTFGRNGRDAERWRLHLHRATTMMNDVVIPGRSLMSTNACYLLHWRGRRYHCTVAQKHFYNVLFAHCAYA